MELTTARANTKSSCSAHFVFLQSLTAAANTIFRIGYSDLYWMHLAIIATITYFHQVKGVHHIESASYLDLVV